MAEQRIDASVSHVSPARRRGLKAAVAGTAGLLGLPLLVTSLAGCDGKNFNPLTPSAAKFNGVDITGADYAKALSLTDPEGKRRSLAEFKGKVVVVFFGFTQCPDVCPTTMAELAEVRRRLGADGDRVQGVFVTVDPERDSAVVLGEYVKALDPSLVGLRGSVDEVTQAARDFKVFFQKVPSKDGPHGGFLRVRPGRQGAPVPALRPGRGCLGGRHQAIAAGACGQGLMRGPTALSRAAPGSGAPSNSRPVAA